MNHLIKPSTLQQQYPINSRLKKIKWLLQLIYISITIGIFAGLGIFIKGDSFNIVLKNGVFLMGVSAIFFLIIFIIIQIIWKVIKLDYYFFYDIASEGIQINELGNESLVPYSIIKSLEIHQSFTDKVIGSYSLKIMCSTIPFKRYGKHGSIFYLYQNMLMDLRKIIFIDCLSLDSVEALKTIINAKMIDKKQSEK